MIAQQLSVWRTRSMASFQRRDNGDGPADLTTKATHFFKIIMLGTLEEGKLVSILYFLFFFCLWNHMFNIDYRPLHLLYLWFFKKFTFVDDLFNLNLWTSFHVTCSHFVMRRLPHCTYCYSFYLILWIAKNFTLLYGVCLGFFHPFESEQVLL